MRTTRLRLSLWSWKKQAPRRLAGVDAPGCLCAEDKFLFHLGSALHSDGSCLCLGQSECSVALSGGVLFVAGVQQEHRGWLGRGHIRASVAGFLTPALCLYFLGGFVVSLLRCD